MYKLVLAHFYPDLLNLYGDRGNVLALYRRAKLRGIDVSIVRVSVGESFDDKKIDISFIGGGQDSEQNIMKDDFKEDKGDQVRRMIEEGKVFLCICGGYQMLGKYYQEWDGKRIEGLGAIDYYTVGKKERFINDTVYEYVTDEGQIITAVGFENHSGRTYLGEGINPFMKVIKGHGNNGEDGLEGVRYKNVFGTYSHGSFLPKNPEITDQLIEIAMKRRYGKEYKLPPLVMDDELFARKEALNYINNGKEQLI